MQSKQNSITKRNEILQLAPQEIEGLIIDSLGLKVEVIKKEKYAINHEDLEKAFKTANDVVNKYKMLNSVDELLLDIKNDLRSELSQNVEEINRLKDIMLKNEVITFDDI